MPSPSGSKINNLLCRLIRGVPVNFKNNRRTLVLLKPSWNELSRDMWHDYISCFSISRSLIMVVDLEIWITSKSETPYKRWIFAKRIIANQSSAVINQLLQSLVINFNYGCWPWKLYSYGICNSVKPNIYLFKTVIVI